LPRSRKSSARPFGRVSVELAGRNTPTPQAAASYNLVASAQTIADNGSGSAGEWNVKIEIYDQVYNVNADGNEEYLNELAAYVDGKMRSIADATHMVDSLKVAVLAALNIADETFAMRKRQQEIEGPLRKRVEKCVSMVEKALEQTN
jgi:cell division protein ZapA